jgi:hypothetical protein
MRYEDISEIGKVSGGVEARCAAEGVGSIRSGASYRPFPAWLPDTEERDIGRFRTEETALVKQHV